MKIKLSKYLKLFQTTEKNLILTKKQKIILTVLGNILIIDLLNSRDLKKLS